MHNPNAPDYTPRVNPATYGSMNEPSVASAAYTPIEDELKRIESNLASLSVLIGMLDKRLDYYLVQSTPRPNAEMAVTLAASPMSQALQRINLDLYSIEDKLRDIYERIER